MIKKFFLYLCLINCLVFLTGCSDKVKEIVWDISTKNASPTDCEVNSIPGMLGTHDYICQNSSNIYVYHKDAIFVYESMEKLIDADALYHMACNDEVLYYYVTINGGELWCYDFVENTNEIVSDRYNVLSMKADENNIFMFAENKDSSEYEVLAFRGNESAEVLSDWIVDKEAIHFDGYFVYTYNGYNIVAEQGEEGSQYSIVLVEKDDFQYSCAADGVYGYQSSSVNDGVYGKINDNYINIKSDITYEYKGENRKLAAIAAESDYKAKFFPSQVGFCNEDVYILEQYGKGHMGIYENPPAGYKDKDVLFKLSPETGKCEPVYICEKGVQIAGFSVEKNCVYVLTEEGLFQYDLSSSEEECLIETKEYTRMIFESLDDQLYVFSYKEGKSELLLVAE